MNGGERTRCKNNVRFSICSRVEVQGKLLWDIDTLSSDELVKKKRNSTIKSQESFVGIGRYVA